MALVMTGAPALEPVTVSEAKEHLRVDGNFEDVLITSLIVTSRLHVEAALGLALLQQDWKLVLDAWPKDGAVKLPLRPVSAVTDVSVFDAEGATVSVPSSDYVVDVASSPARLAPKGSGWPNPGQRLNGIEIAFRAGYGAAATDVPAPIRQAVLLLVAHWYENREPIAIGSSSVAIPESVSQLLKPYRMVRL